MCRHQISVGYDGSIYDCDFNQMLEIKAVPVAHVRDFDAEKFIARHIQVHNHCFGCTAGAGSSCGGTLES
jgi:radical SAM protein with 4Fe4S-binding SPASM domain